MNSIFSKDSWSEIIQALSAKPARSIITAFGVCWGIFILVLLLSASKGLENGVKRIYQGMAVNSAIIWGQSTTMAYEGYSSGRKIEMKNEDLNYLKSSFSNIRYISSENRNNGTVISGTKKGEYSVKGENPDFLKQWPCKVTRGRFVNYSDIENKTKIAVLGKDIVNELFSPFEDPIGQTITIKGISFLVVGIYQDNFMWADHRNIVIPFSTAQQIFNLGNTVSYMFITAEDQTPITEIKTDVELALKKIYKIHPDDQSAFGGYDLYDGYKQTSDLFTVLTLVSYFVGVLILLSGIIGITNIMLIVVKERTKEIGVRRALGATPKMIIGQILTESIILTFVSGMVGIIFSVGVIAIVNNILDALPDKEEIMFVNPSVDLGAISIAFAILICSGLLAGLIPAQMAINVKPIDALRDE